MLNRLQIYLTAIAIVVVILLSGGSVWYIQGLRISACKAENKTIDQKLEECVSINKNNYEAVKEDGKNKDTLIGNLSQRIKLRDKAIADLQAERQKEIVSHETTTGIAGDILLAELNGMY